MESFVRPVIARSGWHKLLPLGVAVLLLGRSAGAQSSQLFEVGFNGVPDPCVNQGNFSATNFYNGVHGASSQFSFTSYFGSANWLPALYYYWHNTLNFTNVGEMDSVTGFNFERQGTQTYQEAANFYNAGAINCGTTTNSIFLNSSFFNGFNFGGYGGINVWATNVFSGGNSYINIGPNGLAQFGGHNLVFSNTSVNIQSPSAGFQGASSGNVYATGQSAHNHNSFTPAGDLSQTYAFVPLNTSPYELFLGNSVPYVDIQGSGTNLVVRITFLQDTSFDVATNVYYQPGGDGQFYVEWVGTYTNIATGLPTTTYFYLNADPRAGSSTNALFYGDPGTGVPGCFGFFSSPTQLGLGAPTAGNNFNVNVLLDPDTFTNNIYTYANAQVTASTVSTNATGNGLGSIPVNDLPGRVQISATNSLSLCDTALSGMNYLLLNSPKQFSYDGGNQIAAPYADIYLGSTNGNMALTNLLAPVLPTWTGNIQAYVTRWVTNNVINGTTYNIDYRVLLVSSQLSPFGSGQVQNLALYSSNNVVISDTLNIVTSLYLNCTNLLLTTNGYANGAESLDGELNLYSSSISWQTSVPNLSCLTNNGAIRLSTASNFGFNKPYLALFNTGLISALGFMTVNSADFENYGTILANAGSFISQTTATTMSNAVLQATGPISLTASNLVITGTAIQTPNSLTLVASNLLTDQGVNSSNFWSVGASNPGFGYPMGLNLPNNPLNGDLLGTTITNYAVGGATAVQNIWAGKDRGYANSGYQNNAAVGQLVLDALASNGHFYFTGTSTDGTTNAIYVDCLQLKDFAGYQYQSSANLPALTFNTNLVIYYAQALDPVYGSVAEKINHFNGDHLRWMPTYAGKFSSTNLVYPDGTTNAVNAALAASKTIDSDRDGIYNYYDPTPVLVPSQLQFNVMLTNTPVPSARIGWQTIPLAGNYVYYSTNLASPTNWVPFTNFSAYYWLSNNAPAAVPKSGANSFTSPQDYIGLGNVFYPPGPDNTQFTNVWVLDPLTNDVRFYRIMVQPN